MASSAPLATANPPLSYAERAKRAQNARPQQTSQRPVTQSTSSIAPTATAPSSARSAPVNPPPSISKSSSSGSTGSDARTSSTATHGPPPSSKPAFPPSANSSDPKPNGDVNHHGDSSASVPSAPKQTTVPPPNVWTMRKEQMAARVLNQPRTSQPSNQASASGLQSPPPSLESSASSTSTSTSVPANPIKPSPSTAPPVTNGHRVPPAANDDDPFVVKPGRSPSSLKPSLPAIDDAESWPEVGHAATTPPNGKKEGREEEEKGHEREPSQGHGTKKSEKTKWVPVPPEELQFEGPARAQHTRQRSQNPDRNGNRQSLGPSGAGSSSSGQGSQQQSRTHSAAGRRPTPSHAGSVSHSQAQSRTGSVQSSPRHSSIRGGARRLPDDVNTLPVANRSLRSSTTNSPLTYAQPQPLPAQEFIPAVRPYVNTSVSQSGRDPSTLSVIPDSSAAEMNPHAYYHPQPTHLGVSPYHSPRPAGSPVNNPPYLMPPPMPYAGQPAMPQPIPGYGTPPPYPMYAPYGYPYGQPYVYWPPPGVPLPPMSSSPVTNAQLAEGVPPPSMLARPPPPNESDAVAGYRDVGFVLPPPAEHIRHEQGEERGRRTRELSFGSISAGLGGTSKSPSPTPRSPGLGDVLEGAALGLDVSGGQLSAQADSQSGRPTAEVDITESKSFTLFSIGLSPGEPGPARLRSRTRTQSRGLATSVSGQDEAQEKESEQAASSREEPVVALTEIVAKVIDLTDPETKWEFGTTKVADGTAEPTELPHVPPTNDAPGFVGPASSVPPPIPGTNFVPLVTPYASPPLFLPPVAIPQPLNGLPSAPSPSAYAPRQALPGGEDEWEVRDYGYGFGRGAGPNSYSSHPSQSAVSPRDDRPPFRERREFPPHSEREQHYGRPRRGSYGQGGYGYERGGERGSYVGRRGRGLSGGYGGRGYRDRSYSGRGGYAGRGQQTYVPQSQHQSEVNGYYGPASTLTTYIPQPGFDYPYPSYPPPPSQPHLPGAQGAPPPPMPMPQTALHFPLDTTRYYLLGQLEYYLSAQNLATDFFLRQQMDSRGWIPISLIASFNRVRNLTGDPQLVTDVLTLSSLVEVKGSYVRMRSWQQFILPTALPSRVEEDEQPQEHTAAIESQQPQSHPHEEQYALHQNHEGDEEEEEEVEFVL